MNFKKDSFESIKRELEKKFSIRFPTTGLPTEKEKKKYRKVIIEKIWKDYETDGSKITKKDWKELVDNGHIDILLEIHMILASDSLTSAAKDLIQKTFLNTPLSNKNEIGEDITKFKYSKVKKIWTDLANKNIEAKILFEERVGFALANEVYTCVKEENLSKERNRCYFDDKLEEKIKVICQIPGIEKRCRFVSLIFHKYDDIQLAEWYRLSEAIKEVHAYFALLEWWCAFSKRKAESTINWVLKNLEDIHKYMDEYSSWISFRSRLEDSHQKEPEIKIAEGTWEFGIVMKFGEIERMLNDGLCKAFYRFIDRGVDKDISQEILKLMQKTETYRTDIENIKKIIVKKCENTSKKVIITSKNGPDITYAEIQKLILYHRLEEMETVGKFPYV